MTKRWNEHTECPNCGHRFPTLSPFDQWVRDNDRLDSRRDGMYITDGDKFVHRYAVRTKGQVNRDVQYLMVVEVKTFGKELDKAQRDTLHIINQLLRTVTWKKHQGQFANGHEQNTSVVISTLNRTPVQVIHYGVHTLRMSAADPTTSEWILWDKQQITADTLVGLLRFDLHPDSLQLMEHRRHKTINRSPTLFEVH